MGPIAEVAAGISGIFGLLGFIAYAILRVSSRHSRLRLTPELVASLKHHGIPEERLAGLSDKELRAYLNNQGKLSSDLIDKIIATEVTGQQRIVLWVSTGLLILALVLSIAPRLGAAPQTKTATGGTGPLGTMATPLRVEEPPQPADTTTKASEAWAARRERTEVRPDTQSFLPGEVAPQNAEEPRPGGILPPRSSSMVDRDESAATTEEAVSIPVGAFDKFVFADRILPLLMTDQAQFRRLKAENTEQGIWNSRAVVKDADDCHITDDNIRVRLICRWPPTSNDAMALNHHDDMVNAIKYSPSFAGWSCAEVPTPNERWIIVRTICRAGTSGREPARISVTLARQPTGISEVEARFTPNIP